MSKEKHAIRRRRNYIAKKLKEDRQFSPKTYKDKSRYERKNKFNKGYYEDE
jgi:hypothetical protein